MKNWFIFAGIILILALVFTAGYQTKSFFTEPCPEIVKSDTSRTIDSVRLQTAVVKKPYKPKISRIIPAGSADQKDTAALIPAAQYFYQDSIIDSNLAIYINDTTAGEILNRAVSYKLFVPLQIKETITITNTVEIAAAQRAFYFGAEVGTNLQMYRIAPAVEYLDKKGNAFSYNYDLLNKVHSAGYKKRIF